ncbi:MAG: efflux RND transporter permease subunit [Candidatus Caenarcaniphilales bacterium]|nr:efflux RND transporter permease subunit [Candidatus Caenarcaniphilales bacterium]
MTISDLSIKRPVLATVFSLLIVLTGLIAFFKLPVREYPDIDAPVVTVTTVYPGANATVVESEVTNIIEEELTSIEGIRNITSTSRDQVSQVIVEFKLSKNIDIGSQDVREKIARIEFQLPDNTDKPKIAKAEADASPILWVMVKSTEKNLLDLADYVEKNIKDYFQTIDGVSKVIFGGERRKSIQIFIDTKRLAYYDLTVTDVDRALKANNIELPGGLIESQKQEYSVRVDAKLKTLESYSEMIVARKDHSIIKLKDIADVRMGAENDRGFVRFNGERGFGLGIVRQSKANTVKISDEVHKRIEELNGKLSDDINLKVGYDAAKFIRFSIQDLYSTVIFSSLLVLFIIFIFLRNLRSTLIPGVAIPVSLIGVMGGLTILGFTINLMTLLGLIIAVGIVVDDSIVVLENIYRKIEEGYDPKTAASEGTKEITLAVIATTLVLISIFLPVGFMSGLTGRLLSEFAFSLCFATIISSFVALTLAPMLCSKILRSSSDRNQAQKKNTFFRGLYNLSENFFKGLENNYAASIAGTLKFRWIITISSLVISVVVAVFLFQNSPKDFIPNEDRGSFLTILQTRRGSNLNYLDEQIRKAENMLTKIPEVETVISVAAFGRDAPGKVTTGIVINRLVDWDQRSKDVFAIAGPLFAKFQEIPEAFVLPIFPKSGPDSGFGSLPIQIVLKSQDIDFLSNFSEKILTEANRLPRLIFSKSDLSFDKPELDLKINRDKARELGVSMQEISRTLEILFSGDDLTEFNLEGENYKVIAKLAKDEKQEIRKLGEIGVRSESGSLIPLSNLISVKPKVGVEEWNHYNRRRSVTIEAAPIPGVPPSEGLADLEKLILDMVDKQENLPLDFEIDYKGTSKEEKDSNVALYYTFFIALIFAYLFLAGQFESFKNPIVIMSTVPLAITGALLGVAFFTLFPLLTQFAISKGAPFWIQFVIPQFKNISINIYSQIGIIMLIGMASKNGILLVEFIEQLKDKMPLDKAIEEACRLRLRPILMTAFSTVIGIMPIALALGVGSQSRQSLGVVIVSGMIFSTLLTLYVVPSTYAIFNRKKVIPNSIKKPEVVL